MPDRDHVNRRRRRLWRLAAMMTGANRDQAAALLVFLLLLGLYLLTAPRTVVLEDDGLFILSSRFLGIEHPPGYPLFVLLGKVATLLPFGSVAWRVHSLSGLFAALACVLVFWIARRLGLERNVAGFAALGLGVSETFWSQAIIADVYSLHALLLFGLLYLALTQTRSAGDFQGSRRRARWSALLLGLALANHWPLTVLALPAIALLWWPLPLGLWPRLPALFGWFLLGLLPYAWMVWRSWQMPLISFQGPLDDWGSLLGFLFRSGYSGVDESASASWLDQSLYLASTVRQAGWQLLPVGGVLALVGAMAQWQLWGHRIAAALCLLFLGPTLGLVLLLGFDYQPLQREAFRVYAVVAWGVLALWAGLGVRVWLERIGVRWPALAHGRSGRRVADTALATLLLAILLTHLGRNDRHADRLAHAYATALLRGLPSSAALLVRGDMATPATAYLYHVEGLRPDLTLLSEQALILEPRLFDPLRTPLDARTEILNAFIADFPAPVYRLHNDDARAGAFSWLRFRVDPTSAPGSGFGRVSFSMAAEERAFLKQLTSVTRFSDGWNEILRRSLLTRLLDFQTRAELTGQWMETDKAVLSALEHARRLPEAGLRRAELLLAVSPQAHRQEIDALLAQFAHHIHDAGLTKRDFGRFHYVLARLAHQAGDAAAMRAGIAESLRYWPARDNPAHPIARQLNFDAP